ncbi:MAG: hypothetical protein EOO69_13255 [Moraxellaceae bacterium]|nr:MAG: hypothetical protein EOO69_13255 [Moraxellaceae bacterium]
MPIQEQKPLFTSLLFRCLLYICLTSVLTTNSSYAKSFDLEASFTNPFDLALSLVNDDEYNYLSEDEIRSLNRRSTVVNGWTKTSNNRYMNFNTLKWRSFLDVFYQIKVNAPESDKYDYYVESNHIDCVGGIQRRKQKIDYYRANVIISTEENPTPVDYSNMSTAILACNAVKSEYLDEVLRIAQQRVALLEKNIWQ